MVPDTKKFCLDLYGTVDAICAVDGVDRFTSDHLLRAVRALKTLWEESTEGKHFSRTSEKERAQLRNEVIHLYDIVDKSPIQDVLRALAEVYCMAAQVATGHGYSGEHIHEMKKLAEGMEGLEEFTALPVDVRAAVEVAHARLATGERQFPHELHIWFDEISRSFDPLVKKLSATDKAVVGSALIKAKRKIAGQFSTTSPDVGFIERELVMLLHEVSEHMHKRGGQKVLREIDPESALLCLVSCLKKAVDELRLFVKQGRITLLK